MNIKHGKVLLLAGFAAVSLTLAGCDDAKNGSRDNGSPTQPEIDNDADNDTVLDNVDNCRTVFNPMQENADGDAATMAAIDAALAEYRKLGAETVEVSLPSIGQSVAAYYVIAPAEASSNLSRFDGVRYGYRATEYSDLNDMYAKSRAQGFGEEVKRRILIGTYVLSHGYYDAYYLQAQRIRRLIANDFDAAFKQCDVIASPTTPGTAFKFGEKSSDPVQMYLSDIYTIGVNLAGIPALSHPCGEINGLPVGMQLIGPYFSEHRLLNATHQYQQATDWHRRTPAAFA